MKHFNLQRNFAGAALLLLGAIATLPAQAQGTAPPSDVVLFSPASNPGGLVGFIQIFDTTPPQSEFIPAFLPTAANVPNNIGVLFFEDANLTVVSDELWTQAGFWYFASDPDLIDFTANGIRPVAMLVETGQQQDVSSVFGLPLGSMSVQSDVESVPDQASTLALTGLSATVLLMIRRRM